MHIVVVAFDGFNEIDTFVPITMLGRIKDAGWRVSMVGPDPLITSMNGIVAQTHGPLKDIAHADAVIIGSGTRTRAVLDRQDLLDQMRLSPSRQLIAAQCSGALILAKLGVLPGNRACTDELTASWLTKLGCDVLPAPFHAEGNVATAGGCFASQYLACWIIARLRGIDAAAAALASVAPVGEIAQYEARMRSVLAPLLAASPQQN